MTDWADEEACDLKDKWEIAHDYGTHRFDADELAAALRAAFLRGREERTDVNKVHDIEIAQEKFSKVQQKIFLRGRIEGMREADSIVERETRGKAYNTESNAIRLAINAAAAKLEGK